MATGKYDTSRMYTNDVGQSCDSCPQCECPPGKKVGDTWYHEYQDQYDIQDGGDKARCGYCTCRNDTSGQTYTRCDWADSYPIGERTCPSTKVYQCLNERVTSYPGIPLLPPLLYPLILHYKLQ